MAGLSEKRLSDHRAKERRAKRSSWNVDIETESASFWLNVLTDLKAVG